MRTAILGAGALGSVIGGFLARGGRDVALWDINAEHLAAIQSNGLILDGPDGREVIRLPALRPDEATETPDLIVLLTKTTHTAAALEGIAGHIAAGAYVLTLQNGLGNAERIARHVPRTHVLYGCTLMPGRMVVPGHVATQGKG
ncbi:MAG: 2-dehydropantoate 2-reductase [Pseudomonadota bacterium]